MNSLHTFLKNIRFKTFSQFYLWLTKFVYMDTKCKNPFFLYFSGTSNHWPLYMIYS